MKKLFAIFLLMAFSGKGHAQDSAKVEEEPRYFYIAGNLNAAVNTLGTINKRLSPSAEFGVTFGIFDFGLAVGHLNLLKTDTSWFVEIRPTINIFSKGRFSEALCLGVGYKPRSSQGFMTEICNSINFNITFLWSVSVIQGYYFFDGNTSNSNGQFMGLNITRNLIRKNGMNDKRKRRSILN